MFPKSSTDYFRRVFSAVVQQRGGWQRESQNRDLLDALVKIKREAEADGEGRATNVDLKLISYGLV